MLLVVDKFFVVSPGCTEKARIVTVIRQENNGWEIYAWRTVRLLTSTPAEQR